METEYFYIGNEKTDSNKTKDIYSPYQNKHLATIYLAEEEHIQKAIARSKQSYKKNKTMPSYKKAKILQNIAQDIKKNRVELAETLALESGKNINFALGEVDRAVNTFTIASEEAKRIEGEYFPLDAVQKGENKQALVKRFPRGTILGISPFNFPLNLIAHKVAPAIATANPILIKPSSITPLSALNLAKIASRYLPDGMLSILPCKGSDIRSAVTSPDIKMISFTGSPAVGWKLKDLCGKKKICLELGGNAGVIIDKDTDIDDCMDKFIIGAFAYAGQVCIHTQKFYVHTDIYDEFQDKFVAATQKIENGDPLNEEIFLNPMITEEEAIRAENWQNEALDEGAELLCGGSRNGNMFEAT
ncbi:MAG: aldehyde dehydrogenase family protein, partial [Candidatus Cloacimonetes bacterium]|nr:aldehyde dehydrogenase family protein [Candidatus Cloacimonadota bacterium]